MNLNISGIDQHDRKIEGTNDDTIIYGVIREKS